MRVMLLSPPYIPLFMRNARWYTTALSGSFWYPIYLAYCTGLLEREGHEMLLIDAEASGITHEETFAKAKEFSPDLLVLYFTITSLENDLEIGERIRELTGAEVVLVGPSASMNPIDALKKSDKISYLAKGEFDFTVLDLANKVPPREIRGLYWKNKRGEIVENPPRELISGPQLDEFPFVTDVYRRHLNINDYYQTAHRHPFVDLFTGRGCAWGLCTFCLWPHTINREADSGNTPLGHDKKPGRTNLYRRRSMDNVIEELKFIKREMPYIEEIFIQDDVLLEDRAIELSEAILENGLKLRWSCYARASLGYETLKLMKRAGCRTLHVGYESGSQKILNNIRKGTVLDKVVQFTKDAHRAGLYIVADFMTGLPGDTVDTIRETVEFAKRLPVQRYTITPAMPYPETPFFEWLVENDCLKDGRPNYPDLSWDEIVRWNKWSYRKVYLNPRFFFRMLLRPVEWYRLIRSAMYAIPYMFSGDKYSAVPNRSEDGLLKKQMTYKEWDRCWRDFKHVTKVGEYSQKQAELVVERVLEEVELPREFHMLDLGCGIGRTLRKFKEWGYPQIIGIDNSSEAIRQCVERGLVENRDVFKMDGTNTTFTDQEFDTVFSEGVLEHFEDFSAFVKEMCRISKQYVLLIQPNHYSVYGRILSSLSNMFANNVKELRYHMQDFIRVYEKCGFKLTLSESTPLKEFTILLFERRID